MDKKKPLKKICLYLPVHWIAVIDEKARNESTTRTQIIKNWIIGKCLK